MKANSTYESNILHNDFMPHATKYVIDNVPVIPSSKCHVEFLLGSGGFCDVYQVRLVDSQTQTPSFALKGANELYAQDEQTTNELVMEAYILSSLPSYHENIVRLYGITIQLPNTTATKSLNLVLEKVQGTLQDKLDIWRNQLSNNTSEKVVRYSISSWLRRGRQKVQRHHSMLPQRGGGNKNSNDDQTRESLTSQNAISERIRTVVYGICNGMEFLAKNGIVHRDLKPANIGIASDGTVKILDFGFARSMSDLQEWNHESCGSLRYMSPEVALKRKFDIGLPLDVYSFGMVLYEVCTLSLIFPGIPNRQVFKHRVCSMGLRPNIEKSVTDKNLQRLIKLCWDEDSSCRPSFCTIRHELKTIVLSNKRDATKQQDMQQKQEPYIATPTAPQHKDNLQNPKIKGMIPSIGKTKRRGIPQNIRIFPC